MMKYIWITLVCICLAFLKDTEGKPHKGYIWLEINADYKCAKALRRTESSLALLEGNVVFFKKATREITRRATFGRQHSTELETYRYRLSEKYTPWSMIFKEVFTFDDEEDGFAITGLFGRIGADRVSENPITFYDSHFGRIKKKLGWPSSGDGMDFSEFYHNSPVRLHFRVAVEKTKLVGEFSEWKW
ncbi:hypothetical protein Aduo_007798 [Ancylostoma duodenale]